MLLLPLPPLLLREIKLPFPSSGITLKGFSYLRIYILDFKMSVEHVGALMGVGSISL